MRKRGFLTIRRQCAIRELVSLGQDTVDIALHLDMEIGYVRSLASRARIRLLKPEPRGNMHQTLIKLRAQGLSYAVIAERIGSTPGSLAVIAHRLGITRKTHTRTDLDRPSLNTLGYFTQEKAA